MEKINVANQEDFNDSDLESAFEEALRTSPVIGTGRDGIVMRVDTSKIRLGPDKIKEGYAIKVLKIFKNGEAQREYDLQMKAYNVLKNIDEVAQIPEPILVRVQHLSQADKEYLNNHGALLDEDAEILLMDYIEGTDLATLLYNFILSKKGFDEGYLKNMTFEEKNREVAGILNFEFPRDKNDFKELISNRDNLRKLLSYLQKTDFNINEKILDKVERALDLLEKNRIFHNDLHEKNIMLNMDGVPYIIDFGRSVTDKNDNLSEDKAIIRRFREINTKKDVTERINNEKEIQEMLSLVDRIRISDKGDLVSWGKYLSSNNLSIIENKLISSFAEESQLNRNIALLIILNDYPNKNRQKINKIIDKIKETNLPPRIMRKINILISILN